MRARAHVRTSTFGFTIAEAVIAVAISAMALGGAMLLNAHQLKLVKSTRQSNAASFALQDRVEQLRLTAWKNLADTDWLKDHVFNSSPSCSAFLGNYKETLRLSQWPPAAEGGTVIQTLEVTNSATEGFQVKSDGSAMKSQNQGRVDFIVNWTGADSRPRERSIATVISNGGISRVGLTGYGAYAGSSSPTSSTPTTTTATPTPTPTTTATPTPSPATPTPTPTPTPTNNGNGNGNGGNSDNSNGNGNGNGNNGDNGGGQGNIGGKGGKG